MKVFKNSNKKQTKTLRFAAVVASSKSIQSSMFGRTLRYHTHFRQKYSSPEYLPSQTFFCLILYQKKIKLSVWRAFSCVMDKQNTKDYTSMGSKLTPLPIAKTQTVICSSRSITFTNCFIRPCGIYTGRFYSISVRFLSLS